MFSDRDVEVLGHHRSAGVGRTVRAYNVQVSRRQSPEPARCWQQLAQVSINQTACQACNGQKHDETDSDEEAAAATNNQKEQDTSYQEDSALDGFEATDDKPGALSALIGPALSTVATCESNAAFNAFGYIVGSNPVVVKGMVYYHVAAPVADTKPLGPHAKRKKTTVLCAVGEVTNLCDYTFVGARWSAFPSVAIGTQLCKVCASRRRKMRGIAAVNFP